MSCLSITLPFLATLTRLASPLPPLPAQASMAVAEAEPDAALRRQQALFLQQLKANLEDQVRAEEQQGGRAGPSPRIEESGRLPSFPARGIYFQWETLPPLASSLLPLFISS